MDSDKSRLTDVEPLYDSNMNLVAWIEPGRHIWDANMDRAAFIPGNHA
jgi:hypothetical protein